MAANWNAYGFEIAMHPLFQTDGSCLDFTPASLDATLTREAGVFAQKSGAPGVDNHPHPLHRLKRLGQPARAGTLAHGIRLNTDYYYFPAAWTTNRPGMFTGSGMAVELSRRQRLADRRLPGDDLRR